ncbi:MAG: hypothetical protein ACRD4E_05555, partial [Bryobacteraceae bacterium]
ITAVAPPSVSLSRLPTNGIFTITWNSTAGRVYKVQYMNIFDGTNWNDLQEVTAVGPITSVTDFVGNGQQRFYRVILVEPVIPQPVITALMRPTNGIIAITWSSVAGRTYRLQYNDDLTTTNWNDLLPDVTTTASTASATTGFVGDLPHRFYRIMLVP